MNIPYYYSLIIHFMSIPYGTIFILSFSEIIDQQNYDYDYEYEYIMNDDVCVCYQNFFIHLRSNEIYASTELQTFEILNTNLLFVSVILMKHSRLIKINQTEEIFA